MPRAENQGAAEADIFAYLMFCPSFLIVLRIFYEIFFYNHVNLHECVS